MEDYKIDFVIPWVDSRDENWFKEKEEYWIKEGNTPFTDGNQPARYRDWDNLRYWFRSVEKFTPWVNHIYFVTWGHVPEWLNVNHPKITIVNHKDYMPSDYLPVFQSNPIELNFHRIPNLEEHFVYFNDDMFVTSPMRDSDFFVDGLPREMAATYLLSNNGSDDSFQYILFRMNGEVNSHFNYRQCVKKNWKKWFTLKYKKYLLNNFLMLRFRNVSGLFIPHVASSLRKSTIAGVWETIPETMAETCSHRFRNPRDINQYIFRYWEIMNGSFEPTNIFDYSKEFFVVDNNVNELISAIEKQKYKLICINDSVSLSEFDEVKKKVNQAFDKILPEKSSFEL